VSELVRIITGSAPEERNRALDSFCESANAATLLAECEALNTLRQQSPNLYERVRALFFLAAIHRFHLPGRPGVPEDALLPFSGYTHLSRPWPTRSGAACARCAATSGCSAWAIRPTTRCACAPNCCSAAEDGLFPILRESTPVRMDLSHSGWSDIFFLGMDFPRAPASSTSRSTWRARPATRPAPPVEAYLRVIDEPVLRLTSVDLGATADITAGRGVRLRPRLPGPAQGGRHRRRDRPAGHRGLGRACCATCWRGWWAGAGLEIVSKVNGIPKGSRLAVSTNLLACADLRLHAGHRAGRVAHRPLQEEERRLVAARAILGEWIGGSGGGWQDSGGVWPGMKLIQGVPAAEGDPEFGVSRGRLLPSTGSRPRGVSPPRGAAAGFPGAGPRRDGAECRPDPGDGDREIPAALRSRMGRRQEAMDPRRDVAPGGRGTSGHRRRHHRNFFGPIQTIIPWAATSTPRPDRARAREFGETFWGFWMLGGMSGGGMGFIFDPRRKARGPGAPCRDHGAVKRRVGERVPFAMEPVVYDFAINERRHLELRHRRERALMPPATTPSPCPAAAPGTARAAARRGAPRWTLRRSLPRHDPATGGHGADVVRPPAAPVPGRRRRARNRFRCWTNSASTACSTSRFAPISRAAASAWRRTVCPCQPSSRTSSR
jgi:hypothetical protein